MTDMEQKAAAKHFAEYWAGKGYEKGESQPFWLSLLRDVFGVEHPEEYISFEDQVHLDHTSFIDGYIAESKVLVEQKGINKSLTSAIRQSDGSILTPFQQAKRYITELPLSKHPRWVVTCNFKSFLVYDMERPNGEPEEILLENLPTEYYRLSFLIDSKNVSLQREMEVSIAAGEIVGLLYDAFAKQYVDPESERAMKSLNVLCVRLVFCLYAEDAGIFGRRGMFHDYMAQFDARHSRTAIIDLFRVLDQKPEDRDPYLDPDLAAFPYVNGGLFANEDIEIPHFTDEIRTLLLEKASANFNWSEISPTIFGAVFESTLNPETRRSGGMHYTSIENIHKVIDPLFMNELNKEFEEISSIAVERTREKKLKEFQTKLSKLTFFDPACGSGNFLTETYLSLRRLENEVISLLHKGQIVMDLGNPIQVSISQFYGIEINDFAVTVAKTALWIAESQMMKETEDVVHMSLDFLPLKTNAYIVEGNALRMDWESVVPKSQLNYIMGNPPFVGHQWRTKDQVEDLEGVCKGIPKYGKLDYVCGWFIRATEYIQGTTINVAFVSTNSITQGESVAVLWKPLFENHIHIDFAYRTFVWTSEAKDKAAVHCVIIGFSCCQSQRKKYLFDHGQCKEAIHINGYLLDAPNVFIQSRGKPLTSKLPEMSKGSQPTDGGYLLLSEEERDKLIDQYPSANVLIKRFVGSKELINNEFRYCLWLKGVSPANYRTIAPVVERLKQVAEARANSPTASVRRNAETPMLFTQIRQPETDYLAVPEVSSQNRKYIPIGFLPADIIASNKLYLVPEASLYMFGVMMSNIHMAWMRMTAGRLKSDYSYSPAVYNNFPWPTPTDEQKAKIEQTAQAILDARALYPDCSLADLYDEVTMPPELRRAHQANDKAVMQAYGFWGKLNTETACVAELMKMYQELVKKCK